MWRGDRVPDDTDRLFAIVTARGTAPQQVEMVAASGRGRRKETNREEETMDGQVKHSAPNLRFSHFGISVRDLERSEDFYTRVLGFTVTDRGEVLGMSLVFLSRDPNEHHQIVLATGRPAQMPANTANPDFGPVINQVSFQMGSLADLKALHTRIKAEGVQGIMPADHGIAWSVYFPDPDGNIIECFVDSDWYIKQPFFEPLDLDRSDADIRRATEALCQRSEGFRPYSDWRAEIALRMTAFRPQP